LKLVCLAAATRILRQRVSSALEIGHQKDCAEFRFKSIFHNQTTSNVEYYVVGQRIYQPRPSEQLEHLVRTGSCIDGPDPRQSLCRRSCLGFQEALLIPVCPFSQPNEVWIIEIDVSKTFDTRDEATTGARRFKAHLSNL
jgi:hypothetical protein